MNIAKLKTRAEGLVTQLTTTDECEKRVYDALSNRSYAAHPSLLNEIAEDTFQFDRYSMVMRLVWKTLDGPGRNWRSIAKGLVLVDHLLRHGAERIVSGVQQHIHDIRGLTDFSYLEGHIDRGNPVREKARELVDLLGNPDRIRVERLRARDLKNQYTSYGNASSSAPPLPPKPSSFGGGGGGGGSSSLEFHSSRSPRNWDESQRDGGGYIGDEWSAAYDRSPSPPAAIPGRFAGHGRTLSTGSDKIDFDAGREEYGERLSRYQEQEKREAAAHAAGAQRHSKDSTGISHGSSSPDRGAGKSNSSKNNDGTKNSSADQKGSGPDFLSGADPFPAAAPNAGGGGHRGGNDFSSFAFNSPPYQNGQQQGGVSTADWNGVGGVSQQGNPGGAGQMVPYGYSAGAQSQQQQQRGQQWVQHQQGDLGGAGQMPPYSYSASARPPPQQQGGQQWVQQPRQGAVQGVLSQSVMQGMQPQQGLHGTQPQQGSQGVQQGYGSHHGQGYGQYGGGPPSQEQQYQQTSQQQQRPASQPQQQYRGQHYQHQAQEQQQQPYQGQSQQTFQGQEQQYYGQQQAYPQQRQQQPFQPQEQQPPLQQQQQIPPQPRHPQQQQQQQQPSPAPSHVHQQQANPPGQISQVQQSQPPQEQPLAPAPQTTASSQHSQTQQQHHHQQHAGQDSGTERDWVPTEVVRAGIGGVDLAAAVGGLRQTGFKPSDVGGGSSVFSGQGRRAIPGGETARPVQRATHKPPPQQSHQTVEYVEEGQEMIVNADTREFQSALGGLRKTGLGSRLRETPQAQQPAPQAPGIFQAPPPNAAAAAVSLRGGPAPQAGSHTVTGAGQWQGLPRGQQQQTGGPAQSQRASWQGAVGQLKSTGLMMGTGKDGSGVSAQGHGGEGQAGAPWQHGVAGLRRTGMLPDSGGVGAMEGLDMGRIDLDEGRGSGQQQQEQQQWHT